jgi:hypothetical protein
MSSSQLPPFEPANPRQRPLNQQQLEAYARLSDPDYGKLDAPETPHAGRRELDPLPAPPDAPGALPAGRRNIDTPVVKPAVAAGPATEEPPAASVQPPADSGPAPATKQAAQQDAQPTELMPAPWANDIPPKDKRHLLILEPELWAMMNWLCNNLPRQSNQRLVRDGLYLHVQNLMAQHCPDWQQHCPDWLRQLAPAGKEK